MWDFPHCRCPRLSWQPGLPPALTERRRLPTTRSPASISLGSLPWDGMNNPARCAGWDAAWSPSRRGFPGWLGRKKAELQRGSCEGGIWRGAFMPRCSPPWRPGQEAGQDMSHFPRDISKAEETEATVGDSRETCRDVKLLLQGCADLPESPSNLSWT